MDGNFRIKALNGNVYTEMYVKDGKTFMNVYSEDGELLDVMEEVASYIPHKEDSSKIGKQ
ncbi:hypothetical protein [Chromobacterium violaceum]|uniref:hypothetical protein n=1 Tax=Chromobacterium violaceum TaxID=536 RepID=UPI0009DA5A44|nr:hypothetical protein [Chromobacterium violaceum]OQS22719.1 hypothetical protein B0T41_18635 [Chromobacterium violaceum]